jgi:hypothetical protein
MIFIPVIYTFHLGRLVSIVTELRVARQGFDSRQGFFSLSPRLDQL